MTPTTLERREMEASASPTKRRRPRASAVILTTALAPAAWGTTYLTTTELLPPGRPLLAGTLRALPAGLVLAAATKRRPVGTWWAKALVLGTLNIGGFFALLFVAAYRLPGGVAATLGAIQPLIAAGLAAIVLHERVRRNVVMAGVLGVVGVGLLVVRASAELDGTGVAAGLAGATSMASGVVLTKRWGRPVPLLTFTAWQLVAGGLVLLPLALGVEGLPAQVTGSNLLGYLWLATAGTGVAYLLWFRGIDTLPVSQVPLLALLSPLVATIAGWLVVDQRLTTAQIAGAALVLVAMCSVSAGPSSGGDRDVDQLDGGSLEHGRPGDGQCGAVDTPGGARRPRAEGGRRLRGRSGSRHLRRGLHPSRPRCTRARRRLRSGGSVRHAPRLGARRAVVRRPVRASGRRARAAALSGTGAPESRLAGHVFHG